MTAVGVPPHLVAALPPSPLVDLPMGFPPSGPGWGGPPAHQMMRVESFGPSGGHAVPSRADLLAPSSAAPPGSGIDILAGRGPPGPSSGSPPVDVASMIAAKVAGHMPGLPGLSSGAFGGGGGSASGSKAAAPFHSSPPLTSASPPWLNGRLDDPKPSHDALYEYSQKLGRRLSELEGEAMQLREERDQLKAENDAIGEHVLGLQQENGMLHDMGWSAFLEKAEISKQAESAKSHFTNMRDSLLQKQELIEKLTSENSALSRSLEQVQNELAQTRHTVHGMEVALDSMQSDLGKRIGAEGLLAERGVELERCVEELAAEKRRMDEVVSGQHIEIAKGSSRSQELHAERAKSHALGQKLQTAEMELSRLMQDKAQLDQVASTLHVELAQLRTQRDTAFAEVPNLQGHVRQQALASADLSEQVRQLQGAMKDLQRTNANLESEVAKYRYGLDGAQKDSVRNEQNANGLFVERGHLRQVIDDLTAKKVDLEEKLNLAIGEKSRLQAHFEAMHVENGQLQIKAQQAGAGASALRSRVVGLERAVQGYHEESAGLQQRCQVMRDEREVLQDRIEQFEKPAARHQVYGAAL